MRLPVLVLLALAAPAFAREPQAIIDEIRPRQEAFKTCLTERAVEVGRGNQESADTIVRAVASLCREQEDALRSLYGEMPMSRYRAELLIERDRKLGEDAGIAALLAARSK